MSHYASASLRRRGSPAALLVVVAALVLVLGLVPTASTAGAPASAPGKPVIGKPAAVPAQPVAGKPLAVSFRVTRSGTGTPLLRGLMVCEPSIGGQAIPHKESFRGGTGRVSFVVPANASGKLLRVKVTITTPAGSATKVSALRVLGLPELSIGEASTSEGSSGTTTLSFPVTLSAASAQPVSVAYATADGTATAPGDYASTSGTLTFAPGQRTRSIAVDVVADLDIEQDETVVMALSDPVNATIATGRATGTITNDDTAVPITQGSYKGLLEGNFLFFDVVDRYVTHFRSNYIRMDCTPGSIYVYGQLDWGSSRFVIGPDGTFKASDTSSGTISGRPATFYEEVTGRFDGPRASGTVLASAEYVRDGVQLKCTNGQKPWTASLQP